MASAKVDGTDPVIGTNIRSSHEVENQGEYEAASSLADFEAMERIAQEKKEAEDSDTTPTN